jgi:hypothetical protein
MTADACGRRSPLEASLQCLLLRPHRLIFMENLGPLSRLVPRSATCGSMLPPVSLRWWDRRMGLVLPLVSQAISASRRAYVPWCHPRRLLVLLHAQVVGSADAGELLPPLGSCGRSWPPFLQKLSFIAIRSCLLPFHRLTPSRPLRGTA